jgi:hypothetical protein
MEGLASYLTTKFKPEGTFLTGERNSIGEHENIEVQEG